MMYCNCKLQLYHFVSELKNVPRDAFAVDPAQSHSAEAVYRCRKCRSDLHLRLISLPSPSLPLPSDACVCALRSRRTLFRRSSILSHCVGSGASAFTHKRPSGGQAAGDQCTSYFIEPVQWMEEALLGVMDGQVKCFVHSLSWWLVLG